MSKEKFERSKPHANIGDIVKTVEHGKSTTVAAFQHAHVSYEKYKQMVLQKLIDEYGEEEGKRRFEILKQEAIEDQKAIQSIGSTFEEKEDGVKFSRGR